MHDVFVSAIALNPAAPLLWVYVLGAILYGLLVVGACTDLFMGKLIPSWVGWVGLCGSAAAAPGLFVNWVPHYLFAVIFGVVFGAMALAGGVGFGDVKIYITLALALGALGVWIILVAHVLALIIAGGYMLIRRRRQGAPMIPFVLLAFLLTTAGLVPTSLTAVMSSLAAMAVLAGTIRRYLVGRLDLSALAARYLDSECASVVITPWVAHRYDADGVTLKSRRAPGGLSLAAAVARSFTDRELAAMDADGYARLTTHTAGGRASTEVWCVGADYVVHARLA